MPAVAPPFTAAQTVFGHGVYLAVAALALFLLPRMIRAVLSLPAEFDWWNRVLAIPVFNLGMFCIGAARVHSLPLIRLTVAMRLWVMAALAALAALQLVPPLALAVGVIDLLSAALTAWALAAEARPPA